MAPFFSHVIFLRQGYDSFRGIRIIDQLVINPDPNFYYTGQWASPFLKGGGDFTPTPCQIRTNELICMVIER